jgi:hypothetical protein
MITITYNDEAALCSRSDHLMGTRLLPSGVDSNNISKTTLETLRLK